MGISGNEFAKKYSFSHIPRIDTRVANHCKSEVNLKRAILTQIDGPRRRQYMIGDMEHEILAQYERNERIFGIGYMKPLYRKTMISSPTLHVGVYI